MLHSIFDPCHKISLTEPKGGRMKRIPIFLNGDPAGYLFNIVPRYFQSWNLILQHITNVLRPSFGSVKKLIELKTCRVIETFEELDPRQKYIALGFRSTLKKPPGGYRCVGKELFRPLDDSKRLYCGKMDARMLRFLKETRKKELTIIYVVRNGVCIQVPRKVVFRKYDLESWDLILRFLGQTMGIQEGVAFICTIFGETLCDPREFQHGYVYVAIPYQEYFIKLDYLKCFQHLCCLHRGNYATLIKPFPYSTKHKKIKKNRRKKKRERANENGQDDEPQTTNEGNSISLYVPPDTNDGTTSIYPSSNRDTLSGDTGNDSTRPRVTSNPQRSSKESSQLNYSVSGSKKRSHSTEKNGNNKKTSKDNKRKERKGSNMKTISCKCEQKNRRNESYEPLIEIDLSGLRDCVCDSTDTSKKKIMEKSRTQNENYDGLKQIDLTGFHVCSCDCCKRCAVVRYVPTQQQNEDSRSVDGVDIRILQRCSCESISENTKSLPAQKVPESPTYEDAPVSCCFCNEIANTSYLQPSSLDQTDVTGDDSIPKLKKRKKIIKSSKKKTDSKKNTIYENCLASCFTFCTKPLDSDSPPVSRETKDGTSEPNSVEQINANGLKPSASKNSRSKKIVTKSDSSLASIDGDAVICCCNCKTSKRNYSDQRDGHVVRDSATELPEDDLNQQENVSDQVSLRSPIYEYSSESSKSVAELEGDFCRQMLDDITTKYCGSLVKSITSSFLTGSLSSHSRTSGASKRKNSPVVESKSDSSETDSDKADYKNENTDKSSNEINSVAMKAEDGFYNQMLGDFMSRSPCCPGGNDAATKRFSRRSTKTSGDKASSTDESDNSGSSLDSNDKISRSEKTSDNGEYTTKVNYVPLTSTQKLYYRMNKAGCCCSRRCRSCSCERSVTKKNQKQRPKTCCTYKPSCKVENDDLHNLKPKKKMIKKCNLKCISPVRTFTSMYINPRPKRRCCVPVLYSYSYLSALSRCVWGCC